MSQHDSSYKTIFSHPEMVRDLLDQFLINFSHLATPRKQPWPPKPPPH